MKTTIIFLCLSVFIVSAFDMKEFRLRGIAALMTCIKNQNGDKETLKRLMSGKHFLEKDIACLANCAMELVGLMKNGKMNLDETVNDLVESQHLDHENSNFLRQNVKNCKIAAEKSTNKCTVAGKFLYCFKGAAGMIH